MMIPGGKSKPRFAAAHPRYAPFNGIIYTAGWTQDVQIVQDLTKHLKAIPICTNAVLAFNTYILYPLEYSASQRS